VALSQYTWFIFLGNPLILVPKLAKASKKDKYVTVTLFQLEKIYGTSPEAQAFVKDLVKGVFAEEFIFFAASHSSISCLDLASLHFSCRAEVRRGRSIPNRTIPRQ